MFVPPEPLSTCIAIPHRARPESKGRDAIDWPGLRRLRIGPSAAVTVRLRPTLDTRAAATLLALRSSELPKEDAMESTDRGITLYGTLWCSDCKRSKRFFGEQRVPYTFVDVD